MGRTTQVLGGQMESRNLMMELSTKAWDIVISSVVGNETVHCMRCSTTRMFPDQRRLAAWNCSNWCMTGNGTLSNMKSGNRYRFLEMLPDIAKKRQISKFFCLCPVAQPATWSLFTLASDASPFSGRHLFLSKSPEFENGLIGSHVSYWTWDKLLSLGCSLVGSTYISKRSRFAALLHSRSGKIVI